MQRLAGDGTLPSNDPESRGLKSKASRYFGRTPSFASFKSAPATTGSNTKASGAGDTGKKNNPIYRAGRSVSSLATRLSLFKRKSAYHMIPATTRSLVSQVFGASLTLIWISGRHMKLMQRQLNPQCHTCPHLTRSSPGQVLEA
jgi:hypothetical protein